MIGHTEVERFMGLDWLQDVNRCEHLSPLFPGSPRRKERPRVYSFLLFRIAVELTAQKSYWTHVEGHSSIACPAPLSQEVYTNEVLTSDNSVLSVAVINTMIKSRLGRKSFIFFYTLQSVFQKSQGRNPDAVTDAETMEEHRLLTCSS